MAEETNCKAGKYHRARFLCIGALAACTAALFAALWVRRWMNSIPNTVRAAELWGATFLRICVLLSAALLLVVGFGFKARFRPLWLASVVTAILAGYAFLLLVAFLVAPPLGGPVACIYPYLPTIPGAFYCLACLKALRDAWRRKGNPYEVGVGGALGALGFVLCLYFTLFFGKAMVLESVLAIG